MKIVFFGTPEYVLPILDSIHKEFKTKEKNSPIVAVITQKPKPQGRKKKLSYSPVDKWAFEKKIPVFYDFSNLPKADLGILAAYGKMVPKSVIESFSLGILNIHPSLLPKYRGASPIQAAIMAGDKQTGVTIIKLDEKMDHGPIVSQFIEKIQPEDTTETLRKRLFLHSAQFLIDLLPAYLSNKINLKNQNHKKATYTKLLTKKDGFIDPKDLKKAFKGKGAKYLERFIRAMQPWPVAWTHLRLSTTARQLKRLKILKAHVKDGKLILDKVQLEGKTEVAWKQFKEAYATAIFE
jgi:methionyl-tRNA formyltransferase